MDWLVSTDASAAAVARGLPEGLAADAVGRFGVLGECPVDNAVGAGSPGIAWRCGPRE